MSRLLEDDEFPSEELAVFYIYFDHSMLAATLVLVVSTIYVMMKATKAMHRYRFYVINELTWSILNDVHMAIYCPVALFPVPCLVSYGLPRAKFAPLSVFGFFLVLSGRMAALISQFMYRFFQSLAPDSRLNSFRWDHASAWKAVLGFVLLTLSITFVIMVPVFFYLSEPEAERAALLAADPSMERLYARFPSMTCLNMGVRLHYAAGVGFFLAVATLVGCYGYVAVVMYANLRRYHLVAHTYKLQVMLFWSLMAQSGVVMVFLIAPAGVGLLGPLLGMRHLPRLSVYIEFMLLCHTPIDCVMILLFIRPYRVFVCRKLRHIKRVFGSQEVRDYSSTVASAFTKV